MWSKLFIDDKPKLKLDRFGKNMAPRIIVSKMVSLEDLYNNDALKSEVLIWCKENPSSDKLLMIKHNEVSEPTGVFISGSSALHLLLARINRYPSWEPSDTDVYILDQPCFSRTKLDTLDMIQVTEATIEDVLMGFDLPVCRVAYYGDEENKTFVVSYQALNAIFTGEYNLVLDCCVCPYLMKILGRMQKYNLRGYKAVFHLLEKEESSSELVPIEEEPSVQYEETNVKIPYLHSRTKNVLKKEPVNSEDVKTPYLYSRVKRVLKKEPVNSEDVKTPYLYSQVKNVLKEYSQVKRVLKEEPVNNKDEDNENKKNKKTSYLYSQGKLISKPELIEIKEQHVIKSPKKKQSPYSYSPQPSVCKAEPIKEETPKKDDVKVHCKDKGCRCHRRINYHNY